MTIRQAVMMAVLLSLIVIQGCPTPVPNVASERALDQGKLRAKTNESVTLDDHIHELPYRVYWKERYTLTLGGKYRLIEERLENYTTWRLDPLDVEVTPARGPSRPMDALRIRRRTGDHQDREERSP